MPTFDYKCKKCGIIEIFHGIKEEPKKVCPECGSKGLVRMISACGAVIIKGKQMNQYSDVKGAKYWRDKNGNLHEVTPSDGSSKSPTVSSKRTRTDAEVEAITRRDRALRQKQRSQASYNRYEKRAKKR